MLKTVLLLAQLIFFIPSVLSQCDEIFQYAGGPGAYNMYFKNVIPNEIIQFDWCTQNVPDKLSVFLGPKDSISFYIGDALPIDLVNQVPGWYRGYLECSYNLDYPDSLVIRKHNDKPPENYPCTTLNPGGKMRFFFRVPKNMCTLKYTVVGNQDDATIYWGCVKTIQEGYFDTADTITTITCGQEPEIYSVDHCSLTVYKFLDMSVNAEYTIDNVVCVGDTGYVHFNPPYDTFSQPLKSGHHLIKVSNEYCTKNYHIVIKSERPCDYYIPNIFNPNTDKFNIFIPGGGEYLLRVYSRWGELIYEGTHYANTGGWNGRTNKELPQGVYVYHIIMKDYDQTFSGDVTIIYNTR